MDRPLHTFRQSWLQIVLWVLAAACIAGPTYREMMAHAQQQYDDHTRQKLLEHMEKYKDRFFDKTAPKKPPSVKTEPPPEPPGLLESINWGVTLPTLAGGGILAALATAVRMRDLRRGQILRDAWAAQLLDQLRGPGPYPKYSVYLRTFGVTNQLEIGFRENRLPGGIDDQSRDLETILAEALEPTVPLVALGRPGEHVGAGRVVAGDNGWQETIALLLRHSTAILMIPSSRPGTLWEVHTLVAAELIGRAVFVMPPTDSSYTDYDVKKNWEQAAQELTPVGLHLPPYDAKGCIFNVFGDGRPRRTKLLEAPITPKNLAKLIREIT